MDNIWFSIETITVKQFFASSFEKGGGEPAMNVIKEEVEANGVLVNTS